MNTPNTLNTPNTQSQPAPKPKRVRFDWTPEREAVVERRWHEGATTEQIGAELGCSKDAVVGRAHRMNLPKRDATMRAAQRVKNGHAPLVEVRTPEENARFARCWRAGETITQLGRKFEITPNAARKWARRLDLPKRDMAMRAVQRLKNGHAPPTFTIDKKPPRPQSITAKLLLSNDPPKAAGHPETWGAITRGTLLEGSAYTPLAPMR